MAGKNAIKSLVLSGVLFSIIVALYALTLPNTNPNYADSDEFIAAAYGWGIPHPPGYPLYTFLAAIFARLPIPFLTFAGKVNLLSSIFHALTVVCIFWIAYWLLAKVADYKTRILAAFGGAASLAVAYGFWLNGIVAEVFALNNFLIALTTLLVVLWSNYKRSPVYLVAAAVSAGLMVSNQQASVVMLPVLAAWVLFNDVKVLKNFRLIQVCVVVAVVAAITPYLYVVIAAHYQPFINWENVHDLRSLIRLISRQAYAEVSPTGNAYVNFSQFTFIAMAKGFSYFASFMYRNFGIFFTIVGLFGCIYLLKTAKRALLIFILGGIFAAGLFFAVYSPIDWQLAGKDDFPVALLIAQRFYISSFLFFALLVSAGIAGLMNLFAGKKWLQLVIPAVVLIMIGGLFIESRKLVTANDFTIARDYARTMLKIPEKNAVVLFYTLERGGLLSYYAQQVEGIRPDLILLAGDFGSRPKEQILKKHPGLIKTLSTDDPVSARDLIRWNIDKRPIYLVSVNSQPGALSVLNLNGDPFFVVPQGCGLLKVDKRFVAKDIKDPCKPLEERLLASLKKTPTLYQNYMISFFASNHAAYSHVYARYECTDNVVREFSRAMTLYPDYSNLKNEIQITNTKNNCIERDPPIIGELIAEAALRAGGGDLGNAAYFYYQATMLEPNRVDLRLRVAEVLMQMNATGFARDEYRDILVLDPKNAEAKKGLQKLGIYH